MHIHHISKKHSGDQKKMFIVLRSYLARLSLSRLFQAPTWGFGDDGDDGRGGCEEVVLVVLVVMNIVIVMSRHGEPLPNQSSATPSGPARTLFGDPVIQNCPTL